MLLLTATHSHSERRKVFEAGKGWAKECAGISALLKKKGRLFRK